jgi:hypothetical protein
MEDYGELIDPEQVVRLQLAMAVDRPIRYDPPAEDTSSLAGCSGECLVHRQHIYILCYGNPVIVRSRDYLPGDPSRKYPISHYVGWTGQLPPTRRVRQHGAMSAHHVAQIRPGTMDDEGHAKRSEACPRCGQSLWYYAESPTYSDEYASNALRGQGGQQARPAVMSPMNSGR